MADDEEQWLDSGDTEREPSASPSASSSASCWSPYSAEEDVPSKEVEKRRETGTDARDSAEEANGPVEALGNGESRPVTEAEVKAERWLLSLKRVLSFLQQSELAAQEVLSLRYKHPVMTGPATTGKSPQDISDCRRARTHIRGQLGWANKRVKMAKTLLTRMRYERERGKIPWKKKEKRRLAGEKPAARKRSGQAAKRL